MRAAGLSTLLLVVALHQTLVHAASLDLASLVRQYEDQVRAGEGQETAQVLGRQVGLGEDQQEEAPEEGGTVGQYIGFSYQTMSYLNCISPYHMFSSRPYASIEKQFL